MSPAENRFDALLETPEPAALGPASRAGTNPLPELRSALAKIFHADKQTPREQEEVTALIFLWHDHFDEAHALAQAIANPDGSLIHAILHRREPDYSNAKYWFHRVGQHPSYAATGTAVAALPASAAEQKLRDQFNRDGKWDPIAFTDACQEDSHNGAKNGVFLRQVQKTEFTALLHYLAGLR
jgi:hypothetical protein